MLDSENLKTFVSMAKNLDFWETLSEDYKKQLCENVVYTHYKNGTVVHSANNKCTGVLFLKSGSLRVYMLSEAGKEITLYRLFAGDTCMLSASCILKSVTFDVFVDAEEDTEAYVLGASKFAELADDNPYLKIFALSITVERFSEVMWTFQQILFMSTDKRVANFLLNETAKNDSDTVRLSHETIAKYIGSAREVVSRMLKYFEAEDMVRLGHKSIRIIDRKKLESVLD